MKKIASLLSFLSPCCFSRSFAIGGCCSCLVACFPVLLLLLPPFCSRSLLVLVFPFLCGFWTHGFIASTPFFSGRLLLLHVIINHTDALIGLFVPFLQFNKKKYLLLVQSEGKQEKKKNVPTPILLTTPSIQHQARVRKINVYDRGCYTDITAITRPFQTCAQRCLEAELFSLRVKVLTEKKGHERKAK